MREIIGFDIERMLFVLFEFGVLTKFLLWRFTLGSHFTWSKIRVEANAALKAEPQAGPFIYLDILNHQSLKDSLIHIVSNELATDLFKGSEMTLIFRDFLSEEDERNIHLDVMAVAMRRQSVSTALNAVLYDQG